MLDKLKTYVLTRFLRKTGGIKGESEHLIKKDHAATSIKNPNISYQ